MRIPASVSTFMVLLVAMLGAILYVDSRDIETDVNTAQESRLPNTFPSDDAPFLRYPPGWELTQQDNTNFLLSFTGEENVAHDLMFQIVPNTDPEQSMEDTLRAFLPNEEIAAAGTFETHTYNGLPAARFLFEQEGELGADSSFILVEMIRLDDNRLLNIQSPNPIPEDDWQDIVGDLAMILGSLDTVYTPELTAPAAAEGTGGESAFTVNVEEGWENVDTGDPTTVLLLAPDSTAPEAALQLSRVPKQELVLGLQLPPESIDDLDAVFEALLSTVTLEEEPTDVSFLGYEGKRAQFEAPTQTGSTVWVDYSLLEAGADHFILVQASYLSESAKDTYSDSVATMLESAQVTLPE